MRRTLPSRGRSIALFALALSLGCGGESVVHLSYDRCTPGDACGLGTRCLAAPLSVAQPAPALCTLACAVDGDCPGHRARCVAGVEARPEGASVPVTRCLRGCSDDDDCRSGTRCRHRVNPADPGDRVGLCVPEDGPRPCTTDADCAPFAGRCIGAMCFWEM